MDISVSYIPPHQPVHLEADFDYMKSIGINDVLFAYQENHFQWLDGAVRYGPKIAQDKGLITRAVLWGYANVSGGGRSSKVMLENPDMWRVDPDGEPYAGQWPNPMACYNNPKTINFYKEYVERCREQNIVEIMIDEPSEQECFCKFCRNLFADKYHKDLVEAKQSQAEEYAQFQADIVIDFVEKSCDAVKQVDSELKTSLCIMPKHRYLFEKLAPITKLDIFATDPYWLRPVNKLPFEDAIDVSKYARSLADNCNKPFELYLGAFGIKAGLEPKIYTGSKELIEQSNPDRVTTWSFRGGWGLTRNFLEEESNNPLKAWESIVKLYKELSQ